MILELENNSKYVVVDALEQNEKKYFLLTRLMPDGNSLNNEFDMCLYDDENNYFVSIDDEFEYNNIRDIFNTRLDNKRQSLENIDSDSMFKMVKFKVTNINDYKYTLEQENGQSLVLDIEIFGDLKIQVNDYVYINEATTKENITIIFGPVYTDLTELIRVKRGNEIFYLQRYYG